MTDWVKQYFTDVDTLDVGAFLNWLSDDIVVQWANAEPMVGKDAVAESIGGFYQAIDRMRHQLVNVYEHDSEAFAEAIVTYTRKDGQDVDVRAMSVFRRPDQLVEELTGLSGHRPRVCLMNGRCHKVGRLSPVRTIVAICARRADAER